MQTYTDLILIQSLNGASHLTVGLRMNSDNGSNYSGTEIAGNGSVASSARQTSDTYSRLTNFGGPDTTGRSLVISHFMDYTNSTTFQTVISRANNAGGSFPGSQQTVSLWRNTSAITSINLMTASGAQFAVGSTFTLYGIKAA